MQIQGKQSKKWAKRGPDTKNRDRKTEKQRSHTANNIMNSRGAVKPLESLAGRVPAKASTGKKENESFDVGEKEAKRTRKEQEKNKNRKRRRRLTFQLMSKEAPHLPP
jgi:hypothetical protein